MQGLQLSDGTWIRTGESELRQYAALRAPDGRITTLTTSPLCRLLDWGSQLLTACPLQGPSVRLVDALTLTAIHPEAELPNPPRLARHVIADEGRFLFAQSRLSDGEQERVLMRFDGQAWQQFPSISSEPLYSRRGWLVLKDPLRVVPAERPEQSAQILPAGLGLDELDLLEHSVVFVQRQGTSSGQAELVELDLLTGNVTSRTPFPGQPGKLAFADAGMAVALAGRGAGLHMTADRKFAPVALPADPVFGSLDSVACSPDGCSLGEVLAWSRLPAEHEPLVIPSAGETDFEPGEDMSDVGFSLQDYECNTVVPPARPDEELLGLVPIKGPRSSEEEDSQAPLAAIPAYGGQLDLAGTGPGSLSWHGQDSQGAFRTEVAESTAIAKLAGRLPSKRGGPAAALPALVARHFAIFDDAADADEQSHLLLVRESGEFEELVPIGAFWFDTVPLPDGRALVSANFQTHRDVLLIERDGKPSQRRKFLLGVRYNDSLALKDNVPGMLFADDHAPTFYTLVPQTPGTPVALPKSRKAEPCRGPSPADALTLIFTAMPRLTVAGWTGPSRFWASPSGDTQNGELAFVETTPKKACLRSVLLDAPIASQLVSSAPWLHGRMQGQRKSYPLICQGVPAAPPRDSPALELLLMEEEEAKRP